MLSFSDLWFPDMISIICYPLRETLLIYTGHPSHEFSVPIAVLSF